MIKNYISTIAAVIGGAVSKFLGGWSDGMTTLVIFMAIDYLLITPASTPFTKSALVSVEYFLASPAASDTEPTLGIS